MPRALPLVGHLVDDQVRNVLSGVTVPTETMTPILRVFAENQPTTHVMRA